jgi:hypothetical protein
LAALGSVLSRACRVAAIAAIDIVRQRRELAVASWRLVSLMIGETASWRGWWLQIGGLRGPSAFEPGC